MTSYKTWGEMTPEEKGALLLAHHEGREIQSNYNSIFWGEDAAPFWWWDWKYRIKPEKKTVTLYLSEYETITGKGWIGQEVPTSYPKYKITFEETEGEPDCNSVKMEQC